MNDDDVSDATHLQCNLANQRSALEIETAALQAHAAGVKHTTIMDLITVYRTFNAADAQLVRSRLEAAALQAAVVNENAALDLGLGASILVQVPEPDAVTAREIIKSSDIPTGENDGDTQAG